MADDQKSNTVDFLLENQFQNLPFELQSKIVAIGKPTPHFLWKEKVGAQNRTFRSTWYQKKDWMTACPVRKRLFCFPCLLFDSKKRDLSHPWTVKGFDDLAHLSAAATKHERCQTHMENVVKLKLFLKRRSSPQSFLLAQGSTSSFGAHNEEVRRNRSILKRLIDACLYLAVSEESNQRLDISRKLGDLQALLCKYDMHFRESVNASGLLAEDVRTFREDVFRAVVKQIRATIRAEVMSSDFFAIAFNDITCWSAEGQLSVFLRYELQGLVYERLFGFLKTSNKSLDSIIGEICSLISDIDGERKLVSQTYNDQTVGTRNSREIQRQILAAFPMAIHSHSFVQPLEDALLHACYSVDRVKIFFADFAAIHTFFCQSSKFRDLFLNGSGKTKSEYWFVFSETKLELDFRNISTVLENYGLLKSYLTFIRENSTEWDLTSIDRAGSLLVKLNDLSFVFFLHLFDAVLSRCAVFKAALDTSVSQHRVQNLVQEMVDDLKQFQSKEKFLNLFLTSCGFIGGCRGSEANPFKGESPKDSWCEFTLYEIIDCLIDCIRVRFSDLNHMSYRSLIEKRHFNGFQKDFPYDTLNSLKASVYGTLFDFVKLKSELSVIYGSAEFHLDEVELLDFLYKASLSETLSEATKLLKLFLTFPSTAIPPGKLISSVRRMDHRCKSAIVDESFADMLTIATERDLAFSINHEEVINNIDESRYVKLKLFFK